MSEEINQWIFLVIIGLLLIAGCQTKPSKKQEEASAHNSAGNQIKLTDGWARPGSEGGNSAAYLRIYNGTDQPDTLLNISTSVAQKAAVHESYQQNGMTGMRPAGNLVIKPGSDLTLRPGGYHIMLMRLNKALKKGDSVSVELHFSKAGSRRITVPVKLRR